MRISVKTHRDGLIVARQMLPGHSLKLGAVSGVDLDSAAYFDIIREYLGESGKPPDNVDIRALSEEVHEVLTYIGQYGFSILSEEL